MLDPATGTWKQKIQEILFVKSGKLDEADKTRKALRYGSHAIEFTADGNYGFVPVLGTEEIHVFKRGNNGTLERVAKSKGHMGDGPRHVKLHPNGEVVYCVTEHSMFSSNFIETGMLKRRIGNKLDVYTFNTTPTPSLKLVSSQPLYASGSAHSYRGDTLLLAPSANQIFATTRGATHLDPGYISVFSLSSSGLLSGQVEYCETPTSGGKAHAIDLLSKTSESTATDQESLSVPAESVWIVLTDDDPCTQTPEPCASVRILEWDGWDTGGIREVASYAGTEMQGGSHAIFLRVHPDVEEEFSEPSPLDTYMSRTDNSATLPRELLPLSSRIPGMSCLRTNPCVLVYDSLLANSMVLGGQYKEVRVYLQQNQSRANGSAARGDAKGKKLQRTPSHFWEGGRCDPSTWESNPASEAHVLCFADMPTEG